MREELQDLELDKEFLNLAPEAPSLKRKLDKLDIIKNKNFGSAKDPVKRMKR